jgi:Big-like domain-containing protein/cellulase (glycosyl hydrolase family 5)
MPLRHGWRRLCLALLVTALLAGAVPAVAGAAQQGVVLPNPTIADGTLNRIQASGARHVRVFASWRMLEPGRGQMDQRILADYDVLADRLKAMGLGLYLVVTQTPAWATSSGAQNAAPPPGAYASFIGRLADHFRGRVMAYEIWNEPNDTIFWAGGASTSQYAALLRAAYPAAKAADPGARVGTAGLVGNDYGYVGGLYRDGAKGFFDFVSLHTDTGCNFTDPTNSARDVDGRISRWSFTGYREVIATMAAHGDAKPIWMTEIGWQVASGRCPMNRNDPAGVSAAQQADFLTKAYRCLAGDPYVELASWFSLADFGTAFEDGEGYGLFTHAGGARPSLAAFQRVGSATPDRRCGLALDAGGPVIEVASPAEGSAASGALTFRASARDDERVVTLALIVDGKPVRVTRRATLADTWTGWRNLRNGPHTVTFRSEDAAHNVATKSVTVNRVAWGAGEPIATRVSLKVYGGGKTRLVAAQLFTKPAAALPFARGRLLIAFERRAGPRWRKYAAASAVKVQRRKKFKKGKYRVTVTFPGDRAFRPAVARKSFTVR